MALVPDQKFSTFQDGGNPTTGDIIVGLRGGINTKFNWVLPSSVESITGTANQVLVNASSGIPVTGAVTLTTPQDIGTTSSPTFTAIHTGAILDSSSNNVLTFLSDPASVNWLELASATTGASPAWVAHGMDTNVSITSITKGTGQHIHSSENTTTPMIVFSGTGYQHRTNFNFANTSATRTVTYQDATGTLAFLSDIPAGSASALTRVDDTNVTVTLGGTPATALLQAVSLTMGWTGTLAPTRGGLGTGTAPVSGQIPIGNSGGTYTIAAITSGTNILVGNGDGSISIGITGIISPTNGGTGVNNGSNTLTLAGNLATSGAFASTFTMTGATNVTFPTSGTLATTSQLPTPAALTKVDDTNVTVTLGGTPGTALLQATSLTLGWTGTLSGTRGGTGVNNGASTITLGGSLTTSGAFATTFTFTGATNVTFPTSGTLSTTVGTVTSVSGTTNRITSTGGATPVIDISASYVGQSSITTLGTITTGVWTGTTIAVANGGTGITSFGTGVATALGQNVTGTGGIVLATSPAITTPKIAQINDINGNAALSLTATASAVNYFNMQNSSTGNGIQLNAVGSDTDVNLVLVSQGVGTINLQSRATSIPVKILSGTGFQHVTQLSFSNTSATRTVTFPDSDGTVQFAAGAGGLKSFQIFTSGTAQTYTRPAGITSILVEVIGGGGGGGGSLGAASSFGAAGGGGAGGYARLYVASASGTYTYTVGSGGAGGTAGNNAGTGGGTTTFSASSLQATGGNGGSGAGAVLVGATQFEPGGSGGVGTNGDFNSSGAPGSIGLAVLGNLASGNGGSSIYGGGAVSIANATGAGNNAGNYGSGGSGASTTTSSLAGGNGSAGLIIVWEFA